MRKRGGTYANIKDVTMVPLGTTGQAILAVQFTEPVDVSAKEFGFVLTEEQIERIAAFINATRAQRLIYIPRARDPVHIYR